MRGSRGRVAVLAAVFAIGLAASAVPAFGAATPSATVKPNAKLTDGKVVTVKWKSFASKKNKFIAIAECTKAVSDGNSAHCDTGHALIMAATPSGSASFTVHSGAIGTLGESCGTTTANAANCLIGVSGLTKKLAPVTGQAASVNITFKP